MLGLRGGLLTVSVLFEERAGGRDGTIRREEQGRAAGRAAQYNAGTLKDRYITLIAIINVIGLAVF